MTEESSRQRKRGADVRVEHHGSLFLFCPLTAVAEEWFEDHIDPEAQRWGNQVAVEWRFVHDLTNAMLTDGLEVE